MFLGVWSTLLIPGMDNPSNFFAYLILLLVTGVFDDSMGLSVTSRIIVQLLVAIAVCVADDHLITYAGNLFGLGDIGAGAFSFPLTVLAIVTAVNAFNMIDGIDGLAASLALITFSSLSFIFYSKGMDGSLIISLAFCGALIPFLLANFPVKPFKVKIFLGDAGTLMIGFAIVWLLIDGSQPENRALPEPKAFMPVTALWIIGLPLYDLMAVSIKRMSKRKSPMQAGRDHIHHVLLESGCSAKKTLNICILIEMGLCIIGVAMEMAKLEALSFYSFLTGAFIYFYAKNRIQTVASGNYATGSH